MTASQVLDLLTIYRWNRFKQLCVPNSNINGFESDLLVFHSSGYIDEIEIKVSLADFKREFTASTKREKHLSLAHGVFESITLAEFDALCKENPRLLEPVNHKRFPYGNYIKVRRPHLVTRFWYALPMDLALKAMALNLAASEYGFLGITESGKRVHELRKAKNLKASRQFTPEERAKALKSIYHRYWDLKRQELRRKL